MKNTSQSFNSKLIYFFVQPLANSPIYTLGLYHVRKTAMLLGSGCWDRTGNSNIYFARFLPFCFVNAQENIRSIAFPVLVTYGSTHYFLAPWGPEIRPENCIRLSSMPGTAFSTHFTTLSIIICAGLIASFESALNTMAEHCAFFEKFRSMREVMPRGDANFVNFLLRRKFHVTVTHKTERSLSARLCA